MKPVGRKLLDGQVSFCYLMTVRSRTRAERAVDPSDSDQRGGHFLFFMFFGPDEYLDPASY